MKLARSYASLLSVLVLVAIGTLHGVAADFPTAVSEKSADPVVVDPEQITVTVPIEAGNLTAHVQTFDKLDLDSEKGQQELLKKTDPETVRKTNEMIQALVYGATLNDTIVGVKERNLAVNITTLWANMVMTEFGSESDPTIIRGTNESVFQVIGPLVVKLLDKLVHDNGVDSCMIMTEVAKVNADEMTKHLDLQGPMNDISNACLSGFAYSSPELVAAGERYHEIVKPYHNNFNLTLDDHRTLFGKIKEVAKDYKVAAAAAAAAAAEKEAQPRLQKRDFDSFDEVYVDMTKRQPLQEIKKTVTHIAKIYGYFLAFKFTSGVLMRSTLHDGGQQASLNLFKQQFPLNGPGAMHSKKGLNPYQLEYSQVKKMNESGINPFANVGLYTISGVPAKHFWGGGPDMDMMPDNAQPLYANMCKSVMAAQRWQLGTTIHPEWTGTPYWCQSTVIAHVAEVTVKGRTKIKGVPLANLEVARRNLSGIAIFVETIIGLQPGYTLWTLGMIMWTMVAMLSATNPLTWATASPMLLLAFSNSALSSLPSMVGNKIKDYAIAAAQSSAWSYLPPGLRQAFSVGKWFKSNMPASVKKAALRKVQPTEEEEEEEEDEEEEDEVVEKEEKDLGKKLRDLFGSDTDAAIEKLAKVDDLDDDVEDLDEDDFGLDNLFSAYKSPSHDYRKGDNDFLVDDDADADDDDADFYDEQYAEEPQMQIPAPAKTESKESVQPEPWDMWKAAAEVKQSPQPPLYTSFKAPIRTQHYNGLNGPVYRRDIRV